MWPLSFICLLVMLSTISSMVEAMPVKQGPLVPNRQLHWTGLFYTTNPAYATKKTTTSIDIEYKKFLKAKASGRNPTATFRPDSWSRYNYHIETRGLQPREESLPPTRTASAPSASRNATKASCTPPVSNSASNSTCPPPPDRQRQLRLLRRDLYAGSVVAFLSGILILVIYFTQFKFFRYFDYKERWHVEKARYRSIRKVNRMLVNTGSENPFPENIDFHLLAHPPSKFWASIFESECFIGFLFFFERITKAEGKFTSIMKRPKLGDEASGIPLNSPRARRKYGGGDSSEPAVPRGFLSSSVRMASGSELPTPVGSLQRRGRRSRVASLNALRNQSNQDPIDTLSTEDTHHASSETSYQMPSGFGESPWSNEDSQASDGDH
ncbi:hypothetical protein TWF696_005824 [Orbilia brochopaga]|uniref:Uncharacterized protein n=1 Tax=Orbilia brochopaga TaxID=3140254 RepID=A0AAV9V0T8_9PEZI